MAFFITTPRKPSLGDLLGKGIGTGLAQGTKLGLTSYLKGMQQPMTPYQQVQTALRSKELGLKESREKSRVKEWEYTQHKDFKKEALTNYENAFETDMRLKRMKALNDTGKLAGPKTAILLDKLDLPISILGNPNSEEFDKLSKDMLKNIRSYFGARINVVEVQNFLKTIPTLMNSEKGRDRIINNLQLLLAPKKMMYEEYRDLKKEYKKKGKRLPLDIKEKVLNRLSPKLDQLSQNFETGISQDIGKQIAPSTREFETMPQAKNYAGTIIEDDKGNRYKSDGKRWRKI